MSDTLKAQPSVRQSVFEAIQNDLSSPTGPLRTAVEASGQGNELPPLPAGAAAPPPEAPPSAPPVASTGADAPPSDAPTPEGAEAAPSAVPTDGEAPPAVVAGTPEAGVAPEGSTPPGAAPPNLEEYDPVEYEDPELGETIRVLAPKAQAARVRDGYALKAAMSRHATYLGRHKALLEPLITSGQFDTIAALLQRANQDPIFAQQLNGAINAVITGQPVSQAQPQPQPQPQAAPQPVAPPTPADVDAAANGMLQELLNAGVDEYTAQAVVTAQRPLIERQVQQDRLIASWQQQQVQAQQMQARQMQAQQQVTYVLQTASQQLAQRWPDQFTGDPARDEAKMTELYHYAKQAGFDQVYGVNPAMFVVAAQDLASKRTAPAAAPTSTLAQTARAVAGQAGEAIAQRAAATVINRNPAEPPPQPPKDPLKTITTKGRSVKDVARDVAKVIEARAS